MSKGIIYTALGCVALLAALYLTSREEKADIQFELDRTQAQLKAAEEALQKPAMPVEMVKREALLGEGQVLQIKNIYSKNLTVTIQCSRPGLGDRKTFQMELLPNQPKEIGHMEGWAFKRDDQITVSHSEFESLSQIIQN